MAVPIRQVGQNLKTQRTQRELPQRTQRTAAKDAEGFIFRPDRTLREVRNRRIGDGEECWSARRSA